MKQNLLLGLFILSFSASAQTVLLDVDRTNEQEISERGPNLKKFTHIYFHAGLLASKDEAGARIKYGSSVNLALGVRKKFKIGPIYSLGFDIEYQYTDYKLKQTEGKILPDTIINNVSGRMDYNSFCLGLFNRFNFDPHRGNFLGSFLDIGILGVWDISISEISKNKQADGTKIKSIIKNLPYVNDINAKVYARIGFSHISLYGSYLLTDLFKPSWHYPGLPRLVLGMELALF